MMIRGKTSQTSRLTGMLWRWRLTLAITVFMCGLGAWLGYQLSDPRMLPVRLVVVDGELKYLDRAQLEQTVYSSIQGNFFSVDLGRIRSALERMAWVESSRIRRVWPDQLRVHVTENRALAYWGEKTLLNQKGQVFSPQPRPDLGSLPSLYGHDADAVRVLETYRELKPRFAAIGMELETVRLDARSSWRLETRDGLNLVLGVGDPLAKTDRFIRLYPSLTATEGRRIERVDLRYTNGFALGWEPIRDELTRDRLALNRVGSNVGQVDE